MLYKLDCNALSSDCPHCRPTRSSAGRRSFRALAGSAVALAIISGMQAAAADEQSTRQQLSALGLPSIELLTYESDYSAFMAPSVPNDLRQRALRKLWSFPVFSRTDGLASYAGDYTVAEKKLKARRLHKHQTAAVD